MRSRKAESDAEKIVDVFVADRLKDSLSPIVHYFITFFPWREIALSLVIK